MTTLEITVREAMRISPMNTSPVVAGHHKLENVVKGVTIMEAPDIADWIAGGELLLTSLYAAPTGTINPWEFVRKLAEKGVAAIAIKVGRFIERVPEEMIESANLHGLPIIEVDGNVRYVDIMYPIMAELFNNQVTKLNYYKKIQERFTSLALQCAGLGGITQNLADLIGNPVAVYDRNHKCLSATTPELEQYKEVEDLFQRDTLSDKFTYYRQMVLYPALGGKPVSQIVVPIQSFSHVRAFLTVAELNKRMQEIDFICLEHAATVVTLDLVKKVAVEEIEQKFQNDLIDNLISGSTALNNTLERATLIGWDLSKPYTVVLFHIENIHEILTKGGPHPDKMYLQGIKSEINGIIAAAVKKHTRQYILGTKGDNVVLLWPLEDDKKGYSEVIRTTGKIIQEQVASRTKKASIAIGIGDVATSVEDIPRSYKEAQDALTFGSMIKGKQAIEAFSELGVFRILCKFAEKDELQSYVPKPLRLLMDYDRANDTDLLKTLEVFMDSNGNASKAAKTLIIHYKTILYRLDRIKEITGMDLENNENRLEVEMGLKIIRLLGNASRA